MFDFNNEIVAVTSNIVLGAIVITAIICNTITRIKANSESWANSPVRLNHWLKLQEQEMRLTAELYGGNDESAGEPPKSSDNTSSE